jgi:hypothetical protein
VIAYLYVGVLQSSNEYVTVWIGANSRAEGRGLRWSDGSPFSFYNWFPGISMFYCFNPHIRSLKLNVPVLRNAVSNTILNAIFFYDLVVLHKGLIRSFLVVLPSI